MDFRFNINNLLPKRINKLTHTLIPEGFRGDRREYNDCQRLLTRILDDMGEASAKAQGLNKVITSANKLRDTDHIIYLMVNNQENNGLGSIVGLLKTGSKTLFMFDENGYHYQVKPRCILDFYVHESQQRKGLGSELYEFMLAEENLRPIKLAIDRPSDKFLQFLKKYYGLTSIIPQNNKFVVFEGFFEDEIQDSQVNKYASPYSQMQKLNEQKISSNNNDSQSVKSTSVTGTPVRSAYGRYAASRPPCSMANIIHNTAGSNGQPTESPRSFSRRRQVIERPDSLSIRKEDDVDKECANENTDDVNHLIEDDVPDAVSVHETILEPEATTNLIEQAADKLSALSLDSIDKNVDNDEANDDACSVVTSACSQDGIIDDHPTIGGHLDLKFYHSPLW